MKRIPMAGLFAAMASVGVLALGSAPYATEVTPRDRKPPTDWIGFAASPNGRVFQSKPDTEKDARDDAKDECEKAAESKCSAIAVTPSAKVTVLHCEKGQKHNSFVAGSENDRDTADSLAYRKAKDAGFAKDDCEQAYTY